MNGNLQAVFNSKVKIGQTQLTPCITGSLMSNGAFYFSLVILGCFLSVAAVSFEFSFTFLV